MLTKVLDVKHLCAAFDLETLCRAPAHVGTQTRAALAVVRDGNGENRREVGAVQLDELDTDGTLLPEFENAIDGGR